MDKELNTLATPVQEELDANETLGSNENMLEEPTAQSEETNPQTEENDNIETEEDNNSQTEEQEDNYDSVWEQDIDNVDLDKLSNNIGEEDGLQEEKNEEESNEENEEEIEEKQEPKTGIVITKPLKYRGKEIWVKSEEEAIELMQKGLDYSFKMNKIKPLRNIASIIEESGIEPEDVKALADAKNGNEQAIKYLANKFGIEIDEDPFEDEETDNYAPSVQKEDPIQSYYQEISERDPELAGKVSSIWNQIDDTFKKELYQDGVFQAFVGSVQTGEFDQVFPEAVKIKALNPALSWIQAYQYAVQNVGSASNNYKEPTEAIKPRGVKKPQNKRRKKTRTYDDIWDKDLSELEKELFK